MYIVYHGVLDRQIPLSELGLDSRQISTVLISKLLNDRAKEANQHDREKKQEK